MYQRVDVDSKEDPTFEGYSYLNKLGDIEKVSVANDFMGIVDIIIDDETIGIYLEDVPKLIKALEAARKYMES